jgi:predicted RNase H-like HicB family nuclease
MNSFNPEPTATASTSGRRIVLTYKSSYRWTDSIVIGEVLDFPGTIAYGNTIEEARVNLASALRDMAETNWLHGEPLPIPDQSKTSADADIEEPIYLVLQAGQQLVTTVGVGSP